MSVCASCSIPTMVGGGLVKDGKLKKCNKCKDKCTCKCKCKVKGSCKVKKDKAPTQKSSGVSTLRKDSKKKRIVTM